MVEMMSGETAGPSDRGPVLSALAAVGSIVAAVSCCLPLGTFLAAAGLAGASSFIVPLRPYLLGFSVILVGVGFKQAYGGAACRVRRSAFSIILLWAAAAFVLFVLLFPQVLAGFLADRLGVR